MFQLLRAWLLSCSNWVFFDKLEILAACIFMHSKISIYIVFSKTNWILVKLWFRSGIDSRSVESSRNSWVQKRDIKRDRRYIVWVKKTETIHSSAISHSSKGIWVIKLSFCQNDSPMEGSFWLKDSLITLIMFELCLFLYLAQLQ